MLGAGLLVEFQTANDATSVVFAEEFGFVGEVVDLVLVNHGCQLRAESSRLTMKNDRNATTIVARPSKMKIHAQPGLPPIPSICTMAAASRPPKDPARAAAEKKMAARMPNSE